MRHTLVLSLALATAASVRPAISASPDPPAAPTIVAPKPIAAKVQGGTVTLTVEPRSVTVIAVQP